MRALRFVASYSSTPKPRRGHRRVSGGGSVSGAEPLLVGVTTPPASGPSSAAGASAKKTDAQNQNSRKAGAQKAATSAQPLTPEERERLEWMRQQRPPHWVNNIV